MVPRLYGFLAPKGRGKMGVNWTGGVRLRLSRGDCGIAASARRYGTLKQAVLPFAYQIREQPMARRIYSVKALWDDEAKVFYSESDIEGLHIEAPTIEAFEEVLFDAAVELIVANHISADELEGVTGRSRLPLVSFLESLDLDDLPLEREVDTERETVPIYMDRPKLDNEYRCFLETKVSRARDDIAAGRVMSAEETEKLFAERALSR
ncbi:DUF1902 domain-containing protein [Affinirhizobium pseudoryzae]|uniref:DUF1902 domain-containing protein n=1 Tax=Allorhizobium pseudoryzae TaxID=379684 RepID=UPI0013EB6CD4|nr:DUF1902 domain-containing protein [Allorhizobium pseudoryzae]